MCNRRFVRPLSLSAISVLATWTVPTARGQCEPGWQSLPFLSTNGIVYATTMWDPDGPGPQTAKLVVGGTFTTAGRIFANRIATFDPSTGNWGTLGSGFLSGGFTNYAAVYALTTMPNGDLVAAGSFGNAAGVGVSNIARWNSQTGQWDPMGEGLGNYQGEVRALTTLPNGDVIAGGRPGIGGGVLSNGVARWNDTTGQWVPMNTAMGVSLSGGVFALVTLSSGDVVAGGGFGGYMARWNAAAGQWTPVFTGMNNAPVAFASLPNGDLVVGGAFAGAGGAGPFIARWNPSTELWTPLGSGMNSSVTALLTLPNGDLVSGGYFTIAGGVAANRIARWNATTDEWTPMGAGITAGCCHTDYVAVHSIATLPNGDLIAGGNFGAAGGEHQSMIARWGCAGLVCDSIDFNGDGASFDPQDIEAFLSVYGEGPCLPADASCSDIDFNSDGSLFDPCDIESFLLMFSEGPCTLCGV